MTMAGTVYRQTAVAANLKVVMLTLEITYWQQTIQEESLSIFSPIASEISLPISDEERLQE